MSDNSDRLRTGYVHANLEMKARKATAWKFGEWFAKYWPNDDEVAAWLAWKGI